MDLIFGEEEDEEEINLDTKYLKYSRFKNGFLEQWLRNKYELKTNVHSSFTYNEISSLIFLFLIYIRIIISLSTSDGNEELLMYLGRPWHLAAANYLHLEIMFLLWTTNCIAIYLFVIPSPDEHYKWLELFAFMFGIIPHKGIGIGDKKLAINLLKLSRMVLINCCFYLISVPGGCFVAIISTVSLHYSLANFLVFGIPWAMIWTVWGYNLAKVAYFFPGYFFIICYHLKFRLSSIEKRLKNFMKYSNRLTLASKISFIRCLLRDHNNLCKHIDDYNQYWKKYLTLAYVIAVSTVCFLSYVVLLSPIQLIARILYAVVLSSQIHLLVIITYSASNVSQFNEKIFRDLHSIFVGNRFPTSVKLQLMDYIEKVGNNKIGFTLTNKFLITRETFQHVIYNFTSYFLLLVELSR